MKVDKHDWDRLVRNVRVELKNNYIMRDDQAEKAAGKIADMIKKNLGIEVEAE